MGGIMESLSGVTEIFGAGAAGEAAAGTAGIEGAGSSIGSTLAEGVSAMGAFGDKAAGFLGDNMIAPAAEFAKDTGESALASTKDFFSQAWENAKNDIGEKMDKVVVKDESGGINAGATAGNVAYEGGKALLSRSFASGGGEDEQMPDMSQAKAPQAPVAEAQQFNSEDELNKLRNRMNI